MDEQKNNTPLKDEALEEVQGGNTIPIQLPLNPQNLGGLMSPEAILPKQSVVGRPERKITIVDNSQK